MVLQLLLSPATPRVLAEKCPSVLKSVFGNKRYHKAVCEHTLDRNRNCLSLSYQPHLPPRTSLALHVSCMGVSWALTRFCAIRTFGTRMTSPSSTNQKVKRHGKYTAVHVMLSYEYAHVSTNAHPSSVCACAKWMRVLTWLQALQSPKPMSHRERMPGRHMKSTFKCCCNRLERIIVWLDTVLMLILQSVPKAQGCNFSCVCCYDNNQVWVNNVWVKINLETQHINKTYRIHFVRSKVLWSRQRLKSFFPSHGGQNLCGYVVKIFPSV